MEHLQVGVGRVDISPAGRVKREGYLLESYFDGVHDPLYAKGLVLKCGDTKVGILCCDLLWLPREITDPVASEIEAGTGIPRRHVMVACSHTHSAPQVTDNGLVSREEEYVQALAPKLVAAMAEANGALTEAKLTVAKGHEDRVSHDSRFLFEDGTIAWRSPFEGEQATPTGLIDPEVGIVAFTDSRDKVIATLWNFACHASAAGYGQFSADYPGVVSEIVESQMGGLSLFTRGSCGNIHPNEPAEEMGARLGEEVVQRLRAASFSSAGVLASAREEIALPLRDLDPGQMKDVDYICDKTNPENSEGRKTYFRKCYAAFEALRGQADKLFTFIHVIRIGDAVLVGVPGEQFVQSGLEIKARSRCENTFIVNLANDSIGYIPTREAYREGGYQTWIGACSIAPEGGELIVAAALDLIGRVS